MTGNGFLQILLFCVVALLLVKPMGEYMARVFERERTFLDPVLRPIERLLYRIFGVDEEQDMRWTTYTAAMLMLSAVGGFICYIMLRLQGHLPLNPQHYGAKDMPPDLSFNTAMSMMTNTDWQSYTPEQSVSYFTNMVTIGIHWWLSPAIGIVVAIAVVRGFARHSGYGLGNFWVDVTRCMLYIFLPICLVYSLFLVQQGCPQNFAPYTQATTLEGATQTIAQGPVASQESIRTLGLNGGGLFNANSAHPYENPNPLTNFIQMLFFLLIPAGLTFTFGRMVGNTRQGWALFGAMAMLFVAGVGVTYWAEARGNPNISHLGVMSEATSGQPGGNLEGKETRFGIATSSLSGSLATATAAGENCSMFDSFTPIGGLVLVTNLICDETIFGGTGGGLYGMLMYAIVAVFLGGLMVGRTPEYLGKKIDRQEMRMVSLAILLLFVSNMFFTALAANIPLPPGKDSVTISDSNKKDEPKLMASTAAWNHVNNSSPSQFEGGTWNNVGNANAHGLTEILYAYCSATANNGTAMGGLTVNTPYYNYTLGFALLIGRFFLMIPLLAMAGSLVRKQVVPASLGTVSTDGGLFATVLAMTVLIISALEYFPALALGPIIEHLQMMAGKLF